MASSSSSDDSTDSPPVGRQRPGGRAERVRRAVLTAANELLEESGFEAVTFDQVAERAGVHRTTVYRRWATRSELMSDAYRMNVKPLLSIPDTGTLVGDLTSLATELAEHVYVPGTDHSTSSALAAAASSEEVKATLHSVSWNQLDQYAVVVERSIERGEVPAGTDANEMIEMVLGSVWFRYLFMGRPIDQAFAERIATAAVLSAVPSTG